MIHYFFAGTIEEETIKGGWGYSHLVIHKSNTVNVSRILGPKTANLFIADTGGFMIIKSP